MRNIDAELAEQFTADQKRKRVLPGRPAWRIAVIMSTTENTNPDLALLMELPPWEWPADANDTFLEFLRNPEANPADRILAAELAGELPEKTPALLDALLSIVRSNDEPAELRGMAAISLGPTLEEGDLDGFGDEETRVSEEMFDRICMTLRQVHADPNAPKLVRRRALEAAVRAPDDWHKGATRAAYASGDAEWKLTAVFCMQFLPGFDKQILEALGSDDEEILCEAIGATGAWSLDAAWSDVVNMVRTRSVSKPLLLAAIAAVGSIRPQQAIEVLAELVDDPDEDIADAVQEALMTPELEELEEFDE